MSRAPGPAKDTGARFVLVGVLSGSARIVAAAAKPKKMLALRRRLEAVDKIDEKES